MVVDTHSHPVGLDETVAFINTLEYENGAPVDRLATPEAALAWLAGRQLVHPEAATPDARALARVRRVRAGLREVVDAIVERRPPAAGALAAVNRVLRARAAVQLEAAPGGITVGHRHGRDTIDDALARLAEPLVAEIATGHPERLRVCANDRCRWVFYDASPSARRRWCDMAVCGNRAKAARHRQRVRAAGRIAGAVA